MKKVLYAIVIAVVVVLTGFGAFLTLLKPDRARPRDIRVATSPAAIERGRYLFENVADCGGCHSDRDWTRYTAPEKAGRRGVGLAFPEELGLPGRVVAPNITPDADTGIGRWTDGEKIRAIREGISRDGRALFGFMPYRAFAQMSDADVQALVAYLNSMPPVRNAVPATRLDFPVSFFNRLGPKPVPGPVAAPDRSNPIRYGEYLATLGACGECHSQLDKGKPVSGLEFAGGQPFQIGTLVVHSANITPDEETGIGKWSEDRFITRFRANRELTLKNAPQANQGNFTVMPWPGFAQLSDEDLKALYAYLRTVKPIRNAVETHPPQPAS